MTNHDQEEGDMRFVTMKCDSRFMQTEYTQCDKLTDERFKHDKVQSHKKAEFTGTQFQRRIVMKMKDVLEVRLSIF